MGNESFMVPIFDLVNLMDKKCGFICDKSRYFETDILNLYYMIHQEDKFSSISITLPTFTTTDL